MHIPDGELRDRMTRALDLPADTPIQDAVALLGNGERASAQDTVPLVLSCAAHHLDDYQEALSRTVSALGDRDTSWAMVGGIVACHVGREGLPRDWLTRREPLDLAA